MPIRIDPRTSDLKELLMSAYSRIQPLLMMPHMHEGSCADELLGLTDSEQRGQNDSDQLGSGQGHHRSLAAVMQRRKARKWIGRIDADRLR